MLWEERNERVFIGRCRSPVQVLSAAMDEGNEWLLAVAGYRALALWLAEMNN
jgi:hypothetical protein